MAESNRSLPRKNPNAVRSWATPLTIGAFVLMSATGVLMFFDVTSGLVTVAHQWLSWFFLIGAGGHIVANLRPLQNHLKSRRTQVCVGIFATLFVLSLFSWGIVTGPQMERPIVEALANAPLSALASTTHRTPEELVARMKAHGVDAEASQSIRNIAQAQGIAPNRLLGIVFMPD